MDKSDIESIVIGFLERRAPITNSQRENSRSWNYLESGHMDSFGLINFIMDLEDTIGVEISAEDTQSNEFRFVGSLVELLFAKLSA